jgi:hypothetical protein
LYLCASCNYGPGWAVRGSNPGGGARFSAPLQILLPSLLYKGYRVSFPEVKRSGRGVEYLPSSSAEVKERVELYLYLQWAFVACSSVKFTSFSVELYSSTLKIEVAGSSETLVYV